MAFRLREFVSDLPVRSGYCLDCLSEVFKEPRRAIREYMVEYGIAGRPAHCDICGEHKVTYRGGPSL
jgi:hypothetical protein